MAFYWGQFYKKYLRYQLTDYLDSKVHGANMGPTWHLSVPDGPHVGPMNFAIRVCLKITHLHLLLRLPGVSESFTCGKYGCYLKFNILLTNYLLTSAL